MENFPISPDDCLILQAFRDADSLRDAAARLGCDPAGLARRVQDISTRHGLLRKVNNRWQLTGRGLELAAWVEETLQSQKRLLSSKDRLRIASTMWFGEQVLVPGLPKLRKQLERDSSVLLSVPSKDFELALIDGSVDFVIVCHPPESPEIEHRRVVPEEWVVVMPSAWSKDFRRDSADFAKLVERPFLRHADLNLDSMFPEGHEPRSADFLFDNLIGIRSAVTQGLGWSLVPRFLVRGALHAGDLAEFNVDVPIRDRHVCLWWLRSHEDAKRRATRLTSWLKEIGES